MLETMLIIITEIKSISNYSQITHYYHNINFTKTKAAHYT